jgi:hypothetical protein
MTFLNWLTIHWIIGFTFILIFCALISSLAIKLCRTWVIVVGIKKGIITGVKG